MTLIERIEARVANWLHERAKERALDRFGGIQKCPWCNQWAQLHAGWRFDSVTDPTIDALHCGNCGGVSRWRFEMGMMPLDPIGMTPPPVPCAAGSHAQLSEAARLKEYLRKAGFMMTEPHWLKGRQARKLVIGFEHGDDANAAMQAIAILISQRLENGNG